MLKITNFIKYMSCSGQDVIKYSSGVQLDDREVL